ncbi:C6 zinc finger domain-containing protein [Thozetella sp. PMI_491]|nr:C6 zinc finger domain-containing protein [Thozetella sp. PMI_491]
MDRRQIRETPPLVLPLLGGRPETDCRNRRGKSDLILEGILRLEKSIREMNDKMASPTLGPRRRSSVISPLTPGAGIGQRNLSFSPAAEVQHGAQHTPVSQHDNPASLENAVLDSMHTSTTESVLQWPHFDAFPGLRRDYVPIFQLEQARLPIRTRAMAMHPYATPDDIDGILQAFEGTVNFWYPTMSRTQLHNTREIILNVSSSAPEEDSVHLCLALLTMALGCASQVLRGRAGREVPSIDEQKKRDAKRAMGNLYFDSAVKKLFLAHTDMSSTATHCLFFTALYFAYLRRPLQAWEYINAAAAKCQLLRSYPPPGEAPEDPERIKRIFWSCYILESDYLAELSDLPVSGISRIESSVQLPGEYHTHVDPQEEEQSSLYFLACISMRRLLNRVHQLLYAKGTGASLDNARFPYVVAELSHQLDEWREVLPPTFAFEVGFDGGGTTTEQGGFLRQRYLTCKSVIYRPYLMWVLSGAGSAGFGDGTAGGGPIREDVLAHCKTCLDACLLHILNLRGFTQTVLVDTWICSLSMVGAMLVLLAACRVPSLRSLIGPEVLSAGGHLRQLFLEWQAASGDPSSPSVDQSVHLIGEADRFVRQVYGPV